MRRHFLGKSLGRSLLGLALATSFATLGVAPRAEAQTPPKLALDRFQPQAGSGRILAIPTSETMPLWSFTVDLAVDYARAPLGSVKGGDLISHQFSGQLLAGIGFGRLELGLALPATLYQSAGPNASLLPNTVAKAAMGDLRLNLKVRVTPTAWKGGVALQLDGSFPTGDGASFSGEGGYGIGARAIGDVKLAGDRLQLAGYFGYRYRSQAGQLWSLYVADELLAGLGAQVAAVPRRLFVFANMYGSFGFHSHDTTDAAGATVTHKPDASARPLEWLVGLTVKTPVGLALSFAGGAGVGTDSGSGVTSGYGSPQYRLLAMIGFDAESLDSDRDGLVNFRDRCPSQAGPEANGGCPTATPEEEQLRRAARPTIASTETPAEEPDSDGAASGADEQGATENAAASTPSSSKGGGKSSALATGKSGKSGAASKGGAGKAVAVANEDSGNDAGEPDSADSGAPATPATKTGKTVAATKGKKPKASKSGATVAAAEEPAAEEAPAEETSPKPAKGKKPKKGKAEVVEAQDEEPAPAPVKHARRSGAINYDAEQMGEGEKVNGALAARINFGLGDSHLSSSWASALHLVAKELKDHPEIERIAIEGHADETGPEDFNQKLSIERAERVAKFLIDEGIDSKRLIVRGFGSSQPIVSDTKGAADRAVNRRVEFRVIK
jgi:outer membrane protein OmpA-like peptidoglycan-associated protein